MKKLVIIGVDPGKETGLALYFNRSLLTKDSVAASEVLTRVSRWVHNTLGKFGDNAQVIIAVERYQVGGNTVKKTRQPDAVEILGALRLIARGNPQVRVVVSNASDAKKIASPATLKRIGWWTPGHGHINDATCQIIRALAAERPEEFAEVIGL